MINANDVIYVGFLGNKTNRELGKILDAKVKEQAVKCGFESGLQYDPWDLRFKLEDSYAYFDIKLSCSSSITISERELSFANEVVNQGHTYSIVEFVLDEFDGNACFTGVLDIMDLIEEDLVKQSKFAPSSAYSAQTHYYIRKSVPDYLYETEF